MKRLQGKISLITGGAQGIGLATAIKFAQEGATVVVCDIRQDAVDSAVQQCEALGATALGFTHGSTVHGVLAVHNFTMMVHQDEV
mgnify:CR=1 FL=1